MTIATVMKNCVSELFLLIVIWTMGVIVFAMLMYTFEENTNSKIDSGNFLRHIRLGYSRACLEIFCLT